jgi:hypothetical protein
MTKLLLVLAAVCTAAWPADAPRFIGTVVVEWLDDPFIPKMRLREDFGFADAAGKVWLAPAGHVLDGRSLSLLFRAKIGPPFSGEYRRTSVVYDYYCSALTEPWKDVHRMFYHASIAEGVGEADAMIMYMTVYAEGLRWEQAGSSCFRGCHAAAASLTWRPVVEPSALEPIAAWIRQARPGLEEIEQRVDAVTDKPGPHIFTQGFR